MRRFGALIFVAAAWFSPGCTRSRHAVDRLDVVMAPAAEVDVLPLTQEQIRMSFEEKLRANGHFELPKGQSRASGQHSARLRLEVAFVRELERDGHSPAQEEVGAILVIRVGVGDVHSNYEIDSLGRARLSGESLDERQVAARGALASALDEIVQSADLQLAALEKRDVQLVKDLKSNDSRVRQCAVRILADRKNPAVEPALIEDLKSTDLNAVRRAIAGVVELGDIQAVPALIDLARGQDLGFLREIVFALGAIGGEEAEAYLYTVAQGHDEGEIRESAKQALKELQMRRGHARNLQKQDLDKALEGRSHE